MPGSAIERERKGEKDEDRRRGWPLQLLGAPRVHGGVSTDEERWWRRRLVVSWHPSLTRVAPGCGQILAAVFGFQRKAWVACEAVVGVARACFIASCARHGPSSSGRDSRSSHLVPVARVAGNLCRLARPRAVHDQREFVTFFSIFLAHNSIGTKQKHLGQKADTRTKTTLGLAVIVDLIIVFKILI